MSSSSCIGFSVCKNEDYGATYQKRDKEPDVVLPNPNPANYVIHTAHTFSGLQDCMVIRVIYPDCTNYEGVKILLFVGELPDLSPGAKLDPHFCDKGHPSPFARFEPTNRGWQAACELANKLKSFKFGSSA